MSKQESKLDKLDLDGSCHCGAVRFTAKAVDLNKITKCNCSVRSDLSRSSALSEYTTRVLVADGFEIRRYA